MKNRQHNAWSLWSVGDGEPYFIRAYKDKGEAQRAAARLKKSHPYNHYAVNQRKIQARQHFGSRSERRSHARRDSSPRLSIRKYKRENRNGDDMVTYAVGHGRSDLASFPYRDMAKRYKHIYETQGATAARQYEQQTMRAWLNRRR